MQSGIAPSQQPARAETAAAGPSTRFNIAELDDLRTALQAFAIQHGSQENHTPRNLLLALTSEVGGLAQLFQWKGEVPASLPTFTSGEKQAVADELSNILLCLLRLSDVCGVDLGKAVWDKLAKEHAAKQPSGPGRGTTYIGLQQQQQDQQQLPDQTRHTATRITHPPSLTGPYHPASVAAAERLQEYPYTRHQQEGYRPYTSLQAVSYPQTGAASSAAVAAAAAAARSGLQLSITPEGGTGFSPLGLRTQALTHTAAMATPSPQQQQQQQSISLPTMLQQPSQQLAGLPAAVAAAGSLATLEAGLPLAGTAPAAPVGSTGYSTGDLRVLALQLVAKMAHEDPAATLELLTNNPDGTEALVAALSDPQNPAFVSLAAALGQHTSLAASGPSAAESDLAAAAAAMAAAAAPGYREPVASDPAAAAAAAAGVGSSMVSQRSIRDWEASGQLKQEDIAGGSSSSRSRSGFLAEVAAAAAAAQQQQVGDPSYSRLTVSPAAGGSVSEALMRGMSAGLPPLPSPAAAAAATALPPYTGGSSAAAAAAATAAAVSGGSGSAGQGLTIQIPGTGSQQLGRSPKPPQISTAAAAAVAAAAAAASHPISPAAAAANIQDELEDYNTDVRRKRFSDNEIQALTAIAEAANWSLTNLSHQEKAAVCQQFQIGINRLQNFFNNRKPKGLKRGRPRGQHGHGAYAMQGYSPTQEGYRILQQQQQQLEGLGFGVLGAAAASAYAAAGGLPEHGLGSFFDMSQHRSRSHSPEAHQQQQGLQGLSSGDPAAAAAAVMGPQAPAAAVSSEEGSLEPARRRRRAASTQGYSDPDAPAAQGSGDLHHPYSAAEGLATSTQAQGLAAGVARVQRAHSTSAQGSELLSQGSDLGPFGSAVAQGLQGQGVVAVTEGLAAAGLTQGFEQQAQQQLHGSEDAAATAAALATGSGTAAGTDSVGDADRVAANLSVPVPSAAAGTEALEVPPAPPPPAAAAAAADTAAVTTAAAADTGNAGIHPTPGPEQPK